jgi:radical SAM superfamily enzyme YgiQ (UPF0313 family)
LCDAQHAADRCFAALYLHSVCPHDRNMSEILLVTINARYIHTAFGLRYLFANLGELQSRAAIREFENTQNAKEIAEVIIRARPRIVGFGVYIWNTIRTREVLEILRRVAPDILVVLGGPEVSYEYEGERIVELADYLITGEADRAFPELCRALLSGMRPSDSVIHGGLPDLSSVALPYALYSASDIANRVVYVEASRGCPFTCEFCLSSIDVPVRQFDHAAVLHELGALFDRGARSFKFVDRTFNLNVRISTAILQFFLDRMEPDLFVHFEMVPDRFPQALRDIVARFPAGALQLEIGVQTLNPEVERLISRRQDHAKLVDNLSFLRMHTHAYLHVDLIVGLPGESLGSFAQGFDTLVRLNPHEIQIGILKRLKGTPIIRHVDEYQLQFNPEPPYEVLSTRDLSFLEIQLMERFSRYWDLVSNSGNFASSRELLWEQANSPFAAFMEWSEWLYARVGRRSSIELKVLATALFEFLTSVRGLPHDRVGSLIASDYQKGGRSDVPRELAAFTAGVTRSGSRGRKGALRQNRVAGNATK